MRTTARTESRFEFAEGAEAEASLEELEASPLEAAPEAAALAKEVMEGVAQLRVPLKVDIGTGFSWASTKG